MGAPKCGTTSLREYLNHHPDIFIGGKKEIHFFNNNYDKGLNWYKQFFQDATTEKCIGEKSVTYFSNHEVPEKIKKIIPNVKLIFMLRDPVKRTYSQYWQMFQQYGKETLSFDDAIKEELKSNSWRKYLENSKYIVHIKNWEKHFSMGQMFFLTLENLNKANIKKLLKFLEVDDDTDYYKMKKKNIGGGPRSKFLTDVAQNEKIRKIPYLKGFINRVINKRKGKYPPMNSDTKKSLNKYFKPYNEQLIEYINTLDISKWESV